MNIQTLLNKANKILGSSSSKSPKLDSEILLSEVINKMEAFSELDNNFWKPAPLLKKLADESGAFGEAPPPDERSELLSFKKANMGGV